MKTDQFEAIRKASISNIDFIISKREKLADNPVLLDSAVTSLATIQLAINTLADQINKCHIFIDTMYNYPAIEDPDTGDEWIKLTELHEQIWRFQNDE